MKSSEEDHPRRCGENCAIGTYTRYVMGSPPQVRGKRPKECVCADDGRITPAGAGKTDSEIGTIPAH